MDELELRIKLGATTNLKEEINPSKPAGKKNPIEPKGRKTDSTHLTKLEKSQKRPKNDIVLPYSFYKNPKV